MTKVSIKALALAALPAMFAVSATAPAYANENAAPTLKVHYGDLDLGTANGVAMLDHRIDAAVRQMCNRNVDPKDLKAFEQSRHCDRVARASVKSQREVAIANAQQAGSPELAIALK